MAEAYGNQVERWRAKVVGEVVSQDEATATLRSTALWCSVGWGFQVYGSLGRASVGGQSSGELEFYAHSETGASVETQVATKEATFERRGADYTVRCEASVKLQGGYQDGTSTAAVDVTVPARDLVRPGSPSLNVPGSAGPGQKVTVSWARASSQGNAAFLRFELYENGTKVYSGTATSVERTPSSASPTKVVYELREVHGWYGEELYASSKASVSIVQLSKPGAPSLSSSRSKVQVGDKVTLKWSKAASQGNAEFARFELYENGALVYSGTGTSATRTPSDAEGDSVAYELREVHTFYGTEVYGSASLRVSVVRLAAPTAPSLSTPAGGSTVDRRSGEVAVSWRHNPADGSAQSAAQLRYGASASGPWQTSDVSGSSQTAKVPAASDGDVYWQVRTKGAFDGSGDPSAAWSPWSSVGMFRARSAPSLKLRAPSALEETPLVVSWDFYDAMGSQASARVEVRRGSRLLASKDAGASPSVSFAASELAVSNGDTLTVSVRATSTTGLSSTATTSLPVRFKAPGEPMIGLVVDDDAMAVWVDAHPGPGVLAESIEVRRDGGLIGVLPGVGGRVFDPTPPLDRPVAYEATSRAASGACSTASAECAVPSRGRACLCWGDGFPERAVAVYGVEVDSVRSAESETFVAAAYEYPVEVYGEHRYHSGTLTCVVMRGDPGSSSAASWAEAAKWAGLFAMRLPGGEAFAVKATVSLSKQTPGVAKASVEWEERSYDGVL